MRYRRILPLLGLPLIHVIRFGLRRLIHIHPHRVLLEVSDVHIRLNILWRVVVRGIPILFDMDIGHFIILLIHIHIDLHLRARLLLLVLNISRKSTVYQFICALVSVWCIQTSDLRTLVYVYIFLPDALLFRKIWGVRDVIWKIIDLLNVDIHFVTWGFRSKFHRWLILLLEVLVTALVDLIVQLLILFVLPVTRSPMRHRRRDLVSPNWPCYHELTAVQHF